MITLCRTSEIRAAEHAALAGGRSVSELMLSAGVGVADFIDERSGRRPGVALFLVGPGNNGGDGLVAAAALAARGWDCRVWGYKRRDATGVPVAAEVQQRLRWLQSSEDLSSASRAATVIVDAVFGIGGRIELPAEVADAFDAAWEERRVRAVPSVARDSPAGSDADYGSADPRAFRSDHTIMIGLAKAGLYRGEAMRRAGLLHLIDIGLTPRETALASLRVVDGEDVRRWLPRRPADTHKRAVGALLVVGGARNYYGAPRLAASAGARVGAGLVTLAVPQAIIPTIASTLLEVTFVPLADGERDDPGRAAKTVRDTLASYQAFIIGPGLGRERQVGAFLSELLGVGGGTNPDDVSNGTHGAFQGRGVIDADGLNWLATQPDWPARLREAELVLTPHPAELARLLGTDSARIVADPCGAAREAAARFEQVIVLKTGHATVADPDGTLTLAPQALPALATAGSGDVLAGVIGGLMAQGLSAREAAASGIFIGVAAGQRAIEQTGTLGLVAGDVVEALPAAMRDLYDARW